MITIIAYRENGEDYCRGSVMDRSDSDHEISFHYNTNEAAAQLASFYLADYEERANEAVNCWEITILYNGYESEEITSTVEEAAAPITKKLIDEEVKRADAAEAEYFLKREEEIRERELKQLKALQAKHPEA